MTGQCFCGSVAFEFDGPTTDIEICHCSRCQRATGSPFASEFRVRADRFRWLLGRGPDLILRRTDTSRTSRLSQVLLQNLRFTIAGGIRRQPGNRNPHRPGRR